MAEKNYYRIRKENELFRRKLTCNENDSLSEDAETDNYDKADVTEVHSKETLRPTEPPTKKSKPTDACECN